MEEKVRSRILEALEDLFLREGYRRITVGELAVRLHCSRRTLYELAPGKEDLFVLVVDELLRRIRGLGEQAVREISDPAEQIEAYLAPGIAQTARATHLFSSDVASLPAAKRLMEAHQRERISGLRDIIEQGSRRGIFRPVDAHLVAEVFSFAYRRATEAEFLAESRLSLAEAYRQLSELLRHGLLRANGAGRASLDGKRPTGANRARSRKETRRPGALRV